LVAMVVAAEAVNVPATEPFVISRLAGMVRLGLLLVRVTTLQPTDALFSVTVHTLERPALKLAGTQVTELGSRPVTRLTVRGLELLPRVAVTVAV